MSKRAKAKQLSKERLKCNKPKRTPSHKKKSHVVKACKELPLYARVDIFKDNNNRMALAELELVEPELWFRHHPNAAMILAEAIKDNF